MSSQEQQNAPGDAAGAAADDSAPPAVNYIDIKLHGVTNVPPTWGNESGAPPIYTDHAFRYAVDVRLGESVHSFNNGRLLQTIPIYTEFIADASLPAIEGIAGDTDAASSAAVDVPSDLAPQKPPAVSAEDVLHPADPAAPGDAATADSPKADPNAPQAPLAILWALGPEADALEQKEEPTGGKKDAKAAGKKGAAPPPTTVEAVKPTPPNPNGQAPCMLRIPLTIQQLAAFEEQVERGQSLQLVFRRALRANCPADWEDTMEQRFQGNVKVPLRPLAEPGAKTFTSEVVLEAFPPEQSKEDEKGKKKAAPKKTKGGAPAILTEEPDANEPHPYTANSTTLSLTVSCHSAITRLPQTRPRPELQPADMIPRRQRPPRRPAEATKQFVAEVEGLVQKIVKDYREHVAVTKPGEDSRASFLNFLQTSGQAHAYKQMLVPTVQSIVKEKFMRKANPTKEEMDRVANELYTYLLDHLHITLNRLFGPSSTTRPEPLDGGTATDRWKRLAMEAEVMQEYAVAAKYHQERLGQVKPGDSGAEQLPNIWSEYAEFCLRVRDVLKAEQGYREALALDFTHLPSLVGYGALLLSRARFTEAEVFLQSAVDISSNSTTWACVALYYDMMLLAMPNTSADDSKRTSYKRESKYAVTQAVRYIEGVDSPSPEDAYRLLAAHLVNLHQEDLANLCLAKADPASPDVERLYATLFFQTQQYEEAVATLTEFLQKNSQDCAARILLGDVLAALGKPTEAEQAYDQALRIDPMCGTGPAYVRLGNMYVSLGKYKDALSSFLVGAKVWPCGLTWLGVGIAYYRLEDMVRAEQALNEANILNNVNPKTWAYLALVCLRQKREDEGDQAFNQAIKNGLNDSFLIAEVGTEQLRIGRPKIAEACFRRSLTICDDDCNTHMYLARTLTNLKRFAEAKEEYEYVVSTSDSDTQKQKAEEQIGLLPAS